jgi:hypothetical protein
MPLRPPVALCTHRGGLLIVVIIGGLPQRRSATHRASKTNFPMTFRACWTQGGRSLVVNRNMMPSHMDLLETSYC